MRIKIILAFSNCIFSEAIGKLLENDPGMEVSSVVGPGQAAGSELECCVILTDFTSLYNTLSISGSEESGRKYQILLIDTCCGLENLVSAVLRKKVSGVLMARSGSAMLKKAIKAVHKGDIWLDKNTFKSILHGINAMNGEKGSALSAREKEIASLIGKGLRNKEIASRLYISETTVKTHLTRIFQKLNMETRSELMVYAIRATA